MTESRLIGYRSVNAGENNPINRLSVGKALKYNDR